MEDIQKYSYLLHWTSNDQRFEVCKTSSVNPLYLIISKTNGYWCLEEINKNKYLTLVPTNESKKIIKNMKNFVVKPKI